MQVRALEVAVCSLKQCRSCIAGWAQDGSAWPSQFWWAWQNPDLPLDAFYRNPCRLSLERAINWRRGTSHCSVHTCVVHTGLRRPHGMRNLACPLLRLLSNSSACHTDWDRVLCDGRPSRSTAQPCFISCRCAVCIACRADFHHQRSFICRVCKQHLCAESSKPAASLQTVSYLSLHSQATMWQHGSVQRV